jgi:hypothetical protein
MYNGWRKINYSILFYSIANAQYLSIKVSWPAAGLVVVVLVAYLVGRYIFSFFANMYICFARLRERMGPLRLSLTPSTVGCFPSPIPRAGYFWGGVFFCVTPHWERIFALLHYCLAKSTSKVPGRYSNRRTNLTHAGALTHWATPRHTPTELRSFLAYIFTANSIIHPWNSNRKYVLCYVMDI